MRITKSNVQFVPKGWGFEKWIDNNALYCGKLLYFVKNRRCSLHYHENKTETFYIHSGKLEVRYSDNLDQLRIHLNSYGDRGLYDFLEKEILEQGDTFYVPPGRVHQMIALEDTELFEFSTHHEETDSYRLIKGD